MRNAIGIRTLLPIGVSGGVLARVSPRARARLGILLVTAAALLFPLVNGNDADIDSAANALAFAALALGLNIVVGFAGLLDLGYAAFFAIGAYAYGVASSWQVQPQWSELLGALAMARPRQPFSYGGW